MYSNDQSSFLRSIEHCLLDVFPSSQKKYTHHVLYMECTVVRLKNMVSEAG